MICIYEANTTSWYGNGLCILQPSSCTVSEIAGGDFNLTLVHPITEDLRWKELQEERIIKAPVPAYKPLEDDGTVIVPAEQATEQCFRIYSVNVDTASHEVTVEARHISYDFMGNMCGTTLSIEEIAAMLGYSNHSNFYKAFKEYYGKTPREYMH
ncbi:MAG: AraC family transcriptional regulator [Clostridia bacterium]|nr:AraC family transcriptional regulator [Clostridia bacterium]